MYKLYCRVGKGKRVHIRHPKVTYLTLCAQDRNEDLPFPERSEEEICKTCLRIEAGGWAFAGYTEEPKVWTRRDREVGIGIGHQSVGG